MTVLVVPNINAKYPQDALQCLASLKEPDGLLICPEHRFDDDATACGRMGLNDEEKILYLIHGFFPLFGNPE